mgnify:CR=1 FL=1
MKPNLVVLLVILLALIIGCSNNFNNIPEKETVQIGAIIALTGSTAAIGKRAQNSFEVLVDLHNNNQDNKKQIELIYEDDAYTPKKTVDSYYFLKQKGIKYFLGMGSGPGLAIAPLIEQDNFIFMSPSATAAAFRTAGNNSFRVVQSSDKEGILIADIINKLGIKKLAVLVHPSDYGMSYLKAVKENFKGEVVLAEALDLNSDYSTEILKVKASGADGLFFVDLGPGASKLLNKRYLLDKNIKLVSHQWVLTPDVIGATKENSEGVIFTAITLDENNLKYQEFAREYQKRYNTEPTFDALIYADGANVLFEAIDQTDGSTEAIRYFILNNKFEGFTGDLEFDEYGDRKEIILRAYIIKNHKIEKFES